MTSRAAILLLVLSYGPCFAYVQDPDPNQSSEETPATAAAEKTGPSATQPPQPAVETKPPKPEKRGELAPAPIPIIDPTIGNGLALGMLYTVKLNTEDKVSPPSTFGVGALKTSNGTWGILGGGQVYLKQDRFRFLAAAATATVNLSFYGVGNEAGQQDKPIAITQKGHGILVGGLVRVFERWYVGSRYYYFKLGTSLDGEASEIPEELSEVQIKMPVAALALHVQRDTRKSQFYPREGSVFDTKLYFSDKAVGALFKYEDYGVAFNQYFRFGDKQVLAYRIKGCAVNGHAPFFAICSLGNPADMRGYPTGRYRDRRMLVGQAEYRRELWWRFGAVAFLGAGQVAPTFSEFNLSNTRPGGGVGVRFAVAPKSHINIRVDYGIGQGSRALYVGIAEAF